MQIVELIPLFEDSPEVCYATKLSSGIDLRYHGYGPISLAPGKRIILGTGYRLCINAPCYEAQIRSRSGLAAKHGICVLNSPGTIDADYEDEIKVILHNTSDTYFTINPNDRIAQLVFCPIYREQTYITDKTENRSGGLGSTGTN